MSHASLSSAATATIFIVLLLGSCKIEAAENVALHKSYSVNPAPNYPLTAEAGDTWQLTDGKRVRVGHLWTSREAVGWVNTRPVEVTIDLAAEVSVAGAAFSTAAGVAGVQWPRAIYVLGSRDGRRYTYLGDLIALDAARGTRPASNGYAAYTFQTEGFAPTTARYIRFMIDGQGPFVFADEIEVFGGVTAGSSTAAEINDTNSYFWQRRVAEVLAAIVTEQQSRIEQRTGKGSTPAPSPAEFMETPAVARTPLASQPVELPLPGRQAALLASLGALEQSPGAQSVSVWAAGPWDPLQMDEPTPPEPAPSMAVHLMNGETRAAAINFRNSTARAVVCTVAVDIDNAPMPAYVSLRRVLWTISDGGEPIASILSPSALKAGELMVSLPAGVTTQIWVSFAPSNLTPGTHSGYVSVRAGAATSQVQIRLQVFKSRMSQLLPLLVGGWDYTDGDANGASELAPAAEIGRILREYGVNVAWATGPTMGFAGGRAGNSRTWDAARLDAWIDAWRSAHRLRAFLNVSDSFGQARRGTPEFAGEIRRWAEFWSSAFRNRGVAPDAVDLLLVDEPHTSEQVDRIVDWAEAIHQAAVGFRVLVTLDIKDPRDVPGRLVDAVDGIILQWNRLQSAEAYQSAIGQLARRHKSVEVYGAEGPALSLDPYGYYRLQAWEAFVTGAAGSSFWSLTDTGGALDSSELTSSRPIYSPLAFSAHRVLATKQLEAIREGAEDYYYLDALRRLSASAAGEHSLPAATRARLLLRSIEQTVLGPSGATNALWLTPRDRSLADAARISAGELIDALAAPSR